MSIKENDVLGRIATAIDDLDMDELAKLYNGLTSHLDLDPIEGAGIEPTEGWHLVPKEGAH